MKSINEMKTTITKLMEDRYRHPTAFEIFSEQMIELGIVRLTFDALANQMLFYTKDQFVHVLDRPDLIEAQSKTSWTLGETLNAPAVEKAIKKLDSGEITSMEFHKEIFSAGVVFCNVYLIPRKIFYMGQDAQYYLENY